MLVDQGATQCFIRRSALSTLPASSSLNFKDVNVRASDAYGRGVRAYMRVLSYQ